MSNCMTAPERAQRHLDSLPRPPFELPVGDADRLLAETLGCTLEAAEEERAARAEVDSSYEAGVEEGASTRSTRLEDALFDLCWRAERYLESGSNSGELLQRLIGDLRALVK